MLENKTILITGSSRGIGAATARLAKEYGADVVLHGRTESDQLTSLAQELNCKYIVCDVIDGTAVKQQVDDILKQTGKIDALINCAGITNAKTFAESTDEDWLGVFQVNVLGTVHFCQAVLPYMQQAKHGKIVNVASIRAYGITSSRPSYSASKAAIINLTATLAKEYAPNILINAVSPGFTETDMSKTWTDRVWAQVKISLLNRIGQPKEIAEMLLFLASDRASFITGQTFLVDGGYSISGK